MGKNCFESWVEKKSLFLTGNGRVWMWCNVDDHRGKLCGCKKNSTRLSEFPTFLLSHRTFLDSNFSNYKLFRTASKQFFRDWDEKGSNCVFRLFPDSIEHQKKDEWINGNDVLCLKLIFWLNEFSRLEIGRSFHADDCFNNCLSVCSFFRQSICLWRVFPIQVSCWSRAGEIVSSIKDFRSLPKVVNILIQDSNALLSKLFRYST